MTICLFRDRCHGLSKGIQNRRSEKVSDNAAHRERTEDNIDQGSQVLPPCQSHQHSDSKEKRGVNNQLDVIFDLGFYDEVGRNA